MRRLLVSLTLVPALLAAAPALAETDEQFEESQCVYEQLSEEDVLVVERALSDDPAISAAAEEELSEGFDSAVQACAAVYDWGPDRTSWGGKHAMAIVAYAQASDDLPAGLAPEQVEAVYDALSEDDRYLFAGPGRKEQDEAWAVRVRAALNAGNIAPADQPAAVFYMLAIADVQLAGGAWAEIFEKNIP